LTAVKDNAVLKTFLIEISSRSITVIEYIDCSLDLTGQRRKKKEEEDSRQTQGVKKEMEKIAK